MFTYHWGHRYQQHIYTFLWAKPGDPLGLKSSLWYLHPCLFRLLKERIMGAFDLHSNHTQKVWAFSYISHAGGEAEFSISVWLEMGLLYLDKLLIFCCKVLVRPIWIHASKFKALETQCDIEFDTNFGPSLTRVVLWFTTYSSIQLGEIEFNC